MAAGDKNPTPKHHQPLFGTPLLISALVTLLLASIHIAESWLIPRPVWDQKFSSLHWIDGFDKGISDIKFQWRIKSNPGKPDRRVNIVAIDEKTLDEVGRWPFSRQETARLVNSLNDQGAAVIAFDIVYAEKDMSALASLGRVSELYATYQRLGLNQVQLEEPFSETMSQLARDEARLKQISFQLDTELEDLYHPGEITPDGDRLLGSPIQSNLVRNLNDAVSRLSSARSMLSKQTLDFLGEIEKFETSNRKFTKQFDSALGVVDFDVEIANAIEKHGATVLGYWIFLDKEELEDISKERLELNQQLIDPAKLQAVRTIGGIGEVPFHLFQQAEGVLANLKEISVATSHHGFFNAQLDEDGTIRRARLLMAYGDRIFPYLGLEAFAAYERRNHRNGEIQLVMSERGIESLQVGAHDIPVKRDYADLDINYIGDAKTFPHFSWVDVVENRLPEGTFQDSIVFVGATAIGLGDYRVTPMNRFYPGVEIHANVTNNILTGDYLANPRWKEWIELLGFVLIGFLVSLVLIKRPASEAIPFSLLMLVVYLAANYYVFIYANIDLNVIFYVLEIILVTFLVMIYRYFTEEKQKKFIKGAFSQYLSPTVIDQLVDDPDKLNLGGQEKVCTAFFSDVAGFSSISEILTPQELVRLLNEYLTEMTQIILDVEGTVDKYEGDAIIAFFGAPLDYEDHAIRACVASIHQQNRLAELRKKWRSEGRPELTIRIGLNTGLMLIGNMGSEMRMDYTMMGDSVNLAARLEGVNKQYGTGILISEPTWEAAKSHVEGREIDIIRVMGKKQPVTVYEILEEKGDLGVKMDSLLDAYSKGLQLYKQRRFAEALVAFEVALGIDSKDGPSTTYVERCRDFVQSPPPDDWDGVYVMKSK